MILPSLKKFTMKQTFHIFTSKPLTIKERGGIEREREVLIENSLWHSPSSLTTSRLWKMCIYVKIHAIICVDIHVYVSNSTYTLILECTQA